MKATEVIDGAIEAVTGNWCQGSLYTQEGQVCMRGALLLGAGGKFEPLTYSDGTSEIDLNLDEYDMAAYMDANHAVTKMLGDGIPAFNDEDSTTEEDVILALKHARELLDE